MLKIVVAGFGFMGITHTGNIFKNPAVQLSGIADKNSKGITDKLKEQSGNFSTGAVTAEELTGVNIYDNLGDAIKNEQPNACVIAVHTNLHYELAKMALEAGTHVFLEKPFTLDVKEGQELIKLAKDRNRILMIGHVVRFMPAYNKLKSWIDSGEFGSLEFLSLSRFSGVPSWGQWKDKQKAFGTSGGALFDLVIHDIDFAQWVCGVPDNINAHCLPGKLSNYDYVSAMWKFENRNLHVRIEGGNSFHADYPFQAAYHARFENASVHYSSGSPDNIIVAADSGISEIPAGNANDGFAAELEYFIECIGSGSQPEKCTPESALETIQTCYRHIES